MFGLANFFIGDVAFYGFYSRELMGVGMFAFSFFVIICQLIHMKIKYNSFYPWEHSTYRNHETNGICWQTVFFMVLDGFLNFMGDLMAILGFQYALFSQINQGVVSTMFGLSSIYIGVMAWIFFHERMNLVHVSSVLPNPFYSSLASYSCWHVWQSSVNQMMIHQTRYSTPTDSLLSIFQSGIPYYSVFLPPCSLL